MLLFFHVPPSRLKIPFLATQFKKLRGKKKSWRDYLFDKIGCKLVILDLHSTYMHVFQHPLLHTSITHIYVYVYIHISNITKHSIPTLLSHREDG